MEMTLESSCEKHALSFIPIQILFSTSVFWNILFTREIRKEEDGKQYKRIFSFAELSICENFHVGTKELYYNYYWEKWHLIYALIETYLTFWICVPLSSQQYNNGNSKINLKIQTKLLFYARSILISLASLRQLRLPKNIPDEMIYIVYFFRLSTHNEQWRFIKNLNGF